MKNHLSIHLPTWLQKFEDSIKYPLIDIEDRMSLVIKLSSLNILEQTGGPFGAAVFEIDSGLLISVGVNLVVKSGYSLAHAEMVALALSQERLGTYDLGKSEFPQHELVTSCEPCAMCFGSIPWSGVSRVICGARDEDARAIGFDEGPKLKDWASALESRGITVITDVKRQEACNVLNRYKENGGKLYNSRQDQ
ncbi:nucleoside deaminase [Chamaesiphon sp.]|uniref:nucleoside deaminase n=1 Tax=Chamaesiphon sp. TaxID=2814140 RepID=UPI003593D5B4